MHMNNYMSYNIEIVYRNGMCFVIEYLVYQSLIYPLLLLNTIYSHITHYFLFVCLDSSICAKSNC